MFVLFMLTAPIITMRLVAEERKLRTLEVLLTAPVSEIEIVLAKFVASMCLHALMLLLSGGICRSCSAYLGDPDWGPIYSGYLGFVLLRQRTDRHRTARLRAHHEPDHRGAACR